MGIFFLQLVQILQSIKDAPICVCIYALICNRIKRNPFVCQPISIDMLKEYFREIIGDSSIFFSCVSSSLYSKYLSQTCLSILTNFDTAKLSPGVAAIINYNNGKCLYMFDYVCFILNSTYINVYIAYDLYRGATW